MSTIERIPYTASGYAPPYFEAYLFLFTTSHTATPNKAIPLGTAIATHGNAPVGSAAVACVACVVSVVAVVTFSATIVVVGACVTSVVVATVGFFVVVALVWINPPPVFRAVFARAGRPRPRYRDDAGRLARSRHSRCARGRPAHLPCQYARCHPAARCHRRLHRHHPLGTPHLFIKQGGSFYE